MTRNARVRSNLAPDPRGRKGMIWLRAGQVLMLLGALVAFSHWLAHLEVFGPGQPPGWLDLAAGYPMGVVLLILGSVVASRKPG